ncbi:MAG: hypothetical protein HYV26_02335, partial [Candidatus Hydrogenedentes bacterium]|nr:hypothetical protein [Candidatus Hydrogenedentota bacterium]
MPSTNQPPYTLTSGVPLGGIGAGAVELGRDGRFRNITINNNRCADTRIPVSPASLLAVRVATEEGIYSRILQLEFTAQKEPTEPARLKSSEYEWRGLYPRSDFHLTDPHCPASLHWSAMAPIVPYDAQASSLPALLVRLRLANAQSYPLDIAVVFNWENLVGLTKARVPATLAPIVPEEVRPKAETWGVAAPPPEETPEGEAPAAPEKNGLLFGDLAAVRDNADGQYCLAVRPHAGTSSSVLTWDHDHLGDWRAFWSAFQMEGVIAGAALRGQAKKSGAV